MKKQQKTDYFENTRKPSDISGEPPFSGNLLLRNKPNFNHPNLIATSCGTVVYDTSQTKPKNGANPNKPNQSQFQKPQNRRFSIAVATENKPNLKPISKKEKPQLSGDTQAKNKKMKSKANFKNSGTNASSCDRVAYDDLGCKVHQESKPNPNPICEDPKAYFVEKTVAGTGNLSSRTESVHWTPNRTYQNKRGIGRCPERVEQPILCKRRSLCGVS